MHKPTKNLKLSTWLMLLAAIPFPLMGQSFETPEHWETPAESFGVEDPKLPWLNVTGQLLWLGRTEADRNQTFVVATTATNSMAVLGTDQLNLPVEAGFRGSVLIGRPACHNIELAYTGVFDQDATAFVDIDPVATGVVQTTRQFFGDDLTSLTAFAYTAHYESDFHSPEINWWFADDGTIIRPFIGARWIRQKEQLHIYETAATGNAGWADFSNDLLGGQVGFQTLLWQRASWFRVQAICKAGAYHNDMEMNAQLTTAGVTTAALNRTFGTTSYSGEVNITALWQITSHLNFHVGYTGLWLSNVGLVGDQNDDFNINTGNGEVDLGGISYQGGHLGVTFTW